MPQCNEQIDCTNQTYYCEWEFRNGMWHSINATVPYNYYCPDPSGGSTSLGTRDDSHMCLYPCPLQRNVDSRGAYCLATYKFWNGRFHVVASKSQNGGSCPGDLARYSEKHPRFSFLVAFEFDSKPYVRATYKFQRGKFVVLEGSAEDGDWPADLVAYSKKNLDFSFLVTLEFFGKAMKSPAAEGKVKRRPKSRR